MTKLPPGFVVEEVRPGVLRLTNENSIPKNVAHFYPVLNSEAPLALAYQLLCAALEEERPKTRVWSDS